MSKDTRQELVKGIVNILFINLAKGDKSINEIAETIVDSMEAPCRYCDGVGSTLVDYGDDYVPEPCTYCNQTGDGPAHEVVTLKGE